MKGFKDKKNRFSGEAMGKIKAAKNKKQEKPEDVKEKTDGTKDEAEEKE